MEHKDLKRVRKHTTTTFVKKQQKHRLSYNGHPSMARPWRGLGVLPIGITKRKKLDVCYTPKLRWGPILAHKNKISGFSFPNINITMRAEGISGNFALVRALEPKITSDHPLFFTTSGGNSFFL